MTLRHHRPGEGDPLIDFIDSSLQTIEDIRYQLKTLKSDLLVIRRSTLQLSKEHNETWNREYERRKADGWTTTTSSTDSSDVPDTGAV